MASLPDVPTIAETLPGFESAAWFAVVAPPKTPQAIVDKINADINEALRQTRHRAAADATLGRADRRHAAGDRRLYARGDRALAQGHQGRQRQARLIDTRKDAMEAIAHRWPAEGLTRVPYWVYSDRDLYEEEQARIFRGPTWNFLCLEAELPGAQQLSPLQPRGHAGRGDPRPGRQRCTRSRTAARIAARCWCSTRAARRATSSASITTGATIFPATSPASRSARGIGGKGGMPAQCRPEEHAPRKLRVETLCGPRVRHAVGRRAAARAISRARDRHPHPPRACARR